MSGPSSSSSLPAKPSAAISDENEDHDESATTQQKEDDSEASSVDVKAMSPEKRQDADDRDANSEQPPLPNEEPPPLPNEEPSGDSADDGWEPVWDENAQAFYFYNRFTQVSQWENPRMPEGANAGSAKVADNGPPGATNQAQGKKPVPGGYDPAIHGDYDPNADYAKAYEPQYEDTFGEQAASADPAAAAAYTATAAFNRFTGKWQKSDLNPDRFSDENKSKRQMNAFFDVDAAANAYDGRSLKAERSNKRISKAELKAYREKRKEKKEERRRAWLRD